MSFALAHFLEDAKEVDTGVEISPGEICDGFGWEGGGWDA
jgi:hypothetical protein